MEKRDWSASLTDDYSPSPWADYVLGCAGTRRHLPRAVDPRRVDPGKQTQNVRFGAVDPDATRWRHSLHTAAIFFLHATGALFAAIFSSSITILAFPYASPPPELVGQRAKIFRDARICELARYCNNVRRARE